MDIYLQARDLRSYSRDPRLIQSNHLQRHKVYLCTSWNLPDSHFFRGTRKSGLERELGFLFSLIYQYPALMLAADLDQLGYDSGTIFQINPRFRCGAFGLMLKEK